MRDEGADGISIGAVARQLRAGLPVLLAIGAVLAVMGTMLVLIYYRTDINPHHLVADPSEIGFLPEYTGAYSYLGVLALWTAGVLSVLTGVIVRGRGALGRHAGFHISLGLLLGLLAADDLFMLHEWAGLLMAEAIGADDVGFMRSRLEGVVFAGIGLLWLAWLFGYRRALLRTEYVLLGLGLLAFGASVVLDMSTYVFPQLEPDSPRRRLFLALLEEMLKLAGIFLMLAYTLRMAVDQFRRVVDGSRGAA